FLNALEIAQKEINIIVDAQIKFSEELNNQQPSKTAWMENKEALQNKEGYYKYLEEKHFNDIEKALLVFDKKEREKELDILFNDIVIKFKEVNEVNEEDNFSGFLFKEAYDLLCKNIIRKLILDKGIRLDHRSVDEIRNIESEISILPRVHGSALFTRGQTQALVITTLGSVRDQQSIDTLEEDTSRKFYLHYNFPPFSVGDVKPRRSQSRREIGHGALAEKAIRAVIPNESDFPYTIRVVSEVLESNGSSSMATVCGTSLSLMDAGVPITKPVAGIALGLVKEGEQYKILTDIMGLEDHYGDMDFKAAGTVDGLTAIQMDLKIDGISINVIRDILEKSKIGRMFILEKMNSTIDKPKEELSHYVPKMFIMKVNVDKIGSIIGPSGRNIKKIIEESCTEIDIKDNGEIFITADTTDKIEKAKNLIEGLVREVKTGEIYNGKVKRITKYGAFVEILPGVEGLLHISNLCHYRVDKVEDIIKLDDEFPVKVIGIDQQGKIDLSKKELTPRPDRNANVDGSQNRRPNKRNYDK
ncbi:MAG: polyribonucleotide nucleotidyltransferase, partial [Atribacterota bacterium]|nr:polyribonucleotide nucleotidyltransferase [Atribacterota bacterium]